jgi:hypothetical protein
LPLTYLLARNHVSTRQFHFQAHLELEAAEVPQELSSKQQVFLRFASLLLLFADNERGAWRWKISTLSVDGGMRTLANQRTK